MLLDDDVYLRLSYLSFCYPFEDAARSDREGDE